MSLGFSIPKKLCEFLLDQCLQRGVNLHYPAKAISLAEDNEGSLAAIRLAKAGDEERSCKCPIAGTSSEGNDERRSTLYSGRHHIWRLVTFRVQHPVPQL